MLSYGLPLAATGLAGTLGYQFDRIVVGASFPPSEFAVYALGAVEIPLGLLIAAAVTNVLVPRLTMLWRDGDTAGVVALWREAMRKTSLVLLPMFAFMMAMSADLVRLLYGPGYSESVDVFRIYLLLMPLRITTWGLIPQAVGQTRINLWASIVILASNVVVAVTLVGPLGLIGPALAAPIAGVMGAFFYLVRLRSIAGLRVRDILPIRTLLGTLAVSVTAALPLIALHQIAMPLTVRLAVAVVVYALAAGLGLRLSGRMTNDDCRRIRALLPGRFRERSAA